VKRLSPSRLVNRALRVAGLEMRRKPDQLIRSPNELSLTFEFVAAHFAWRNAERDVTLVQIGAYDGSTDDPVLEALMLHGWRAVLVEPQRLPFAKLQELHGRNPKIQLFNVAIADRDGPRTLFRIEPAPFLPDWTQRIASFDRDHVLKSQRYVPRSINIEPLIIEDTVECWTFKTLLERAGVQHVDVLQLDTEGYDLELMRLFDIPRRLPAIVNYEHVHLSRAERNDAAELLISNGYRLAMSHTTFDTVAYREAPLA
jgi:FkbM family methyltransferase